MSKYAVLLALLLAVSFFASTSAKCANRTALSNVNAVVHKNTNEKARLIINVNINSLEDYLMIDVTAANVTDLCEGMIKDFRRLETLSLINVNLTKIENGAFQNLPRLKFLSLSVNRLTEIKRGDFTTIPTLAVLYLSRNAIETVEEDAFSDMVALKAVYLDRNKITAINGNTFRGCSRINLLDFSINLIQKIAANAFRDIRPSHSKPLEIRLINNNITDVEPEAFKLHQPVYLHLERNQLFRMSSLLHNLPENSRLYLNKNIFNCVPDDVLDLMRNTTKSLYVQDNPITCDCMNRIEAVLGEEVLGKGELQYNTTLSQCNYGPININ